MSPLPSVLPLPSALPPPSPSTPAISFRYACGLPLIWPGHPLQFVSVQPLPLIGSVQGPLLDPSPPESTLGLRQWVRQSQCLCFGRTTCWSSVEDFFFGR